MRTEQATNIQDDNQALWNDIVHSKGFSSSSAKEDVLKVGKIISTALQDGLKLDVQDTVSRLENITQRNYYDWHIEPYFTSPNQVESIIQSYKINLMDMESDFDQTAQDQFAKCGLNYHADYYYIHEDDGTFLGNFREIQLADVVDCYHYIVLRLTGEK